MLKHLFELNASITSAQWPPLRHGGLGGAGDFPRGNIVSSRPAASGGAASPQNHTVITAHGRAPSPRRCRISESRLGAVGGRDSDSPGAEKRSATPRFAICTWDGLRDSEMEKETLSPCGCRADRPVGTGRRGGGGQTRPGPGHLGGCDSGP
jgi:hypothetical protein